MDSVNEAEKEIEMLTLSYAQLEDRVKELEHLLSEASRDCDMKSKECEHEREAHTILQTENSELKKTLTHKEVLLEVTLADAEKKQQNDVEAIASLEADKFYLIDILKRMKNATKLFGNLLYKTQKECEQEREAHMILQAENNELKKTFTQKDELMKVFLAEAQEEHQRDQEAITQLEAEKSDLKEQVKTLRDTVQDLGDLLYQTQTECDDLTEECEREREAHTTLQAERDKVEKTLIVKEEFPEEREQEAHAIRQAENDINQKDELLKVTLVDAAKKQKDVEAISVLKAETSHWIESLKRMQSAAELFGNLLYKTQKECEREREVHTLLQAENDEIKKSLIHNVALLKISQVDGKEKDRKAKEAIANLEAEKSELITKIKKKQRTVEKLRSLLYKTKKKECNPEVEAKTPVKQARGSACGIETELSYM